MFTYLLLIYILIIHGFLFVSVVRLCYWRKQYKMTLLDTYSLERIRKFFYVLGPILQLCYQVVDRLNKGKGRPATDRRFQLRFVIWWKFFGPTPKATAIRYVNNSPNLQKILQAPDKPYTRQSLTRFEKALGEVKIRQMSSILLQNFLQRGYLKFSDIIIDSFPVYSWLNDVKCMKYPKFDRQLAKKLFQSFNFSSVVEFLPKQKSNAIPYVDKLRCWLHHLLWDIPSQAMSHKLVFKKKERWKVLGIQKPFESVTTYRNFLKIVKQSPHRAAIHQALVCEVNRVLQLHNVRPMKETISSLSDLNWVFHHSHRARDPGIMLTQCTTKDTTFFGRGGLLACTSHLELPLYMELSPTYKLTAKTNLQFLKRLFKIYKEKFWGSQFYGDGEYGLPELRDLVYRRTGVEASFNHYGRMDDTVSLSSNHHRIRLAVERVLGRLALNFQLEHPRSIGKIPVGIHLQLCCFCDLLQVYYNLSIGNKSHPHAMITIRG